MKKSNFVVGSTILVSEGQKTIILGFMAWTSSIVIACLLTWLACNPDYLLSELSHFSQH